MRGKGSKGVALLADSEWELRHPMLQRLLKRSGLQLDDVFLGLATEAQDIASLKRLGVKVLMPLGERALWNALGEHDIARWRGRTAPHPHIPGLWVVPALQPSKLMSRHGTDEDASDLLARHPPRFHGIWMRDIHHAIEVAQGGFSRLPVHYLEDPSADRFAAFADEYFETLGRAVNPFDCLLSWDIETFYKLKKAADESELEEDEVGSFMEEGAILRISFCFKPGYAVSVPWTSTFRPTIMRLLASRGWQCGWNGRTFDIPVVTADGLVVGGPFIDGMDAYHMLQSDLPKGLEWVSSEASDLLPWKHLAQGKPALYSCIDADAGLRDVLYCVDQLKKQGQWNLFLNHVVRLMPLLDAAGARGNKVDRQKRDEIRTKLTEMRDGLVLEIQDYVPRELKPRSIYKTQPDEVSGEFPILATGTETYSQSPCPVSLGRWDVRYELGEAKFCSVCDKVVGNWSDHVKGGKKNNPCKAAGAVAQKRGAWLPRFDYVEDFNPNSSDQLKRYMANFGHPIGKDKRDSSKETADAGHLKKLHKLYGKKFPLYSKTLVVHKVSKTIGTYTPEPDSEDLIHTQYVNSTSSWRLGARKVAHGTQIQNWGKREDESTPTENEEEKAALKLAEEARKQIIARPGHKLVQIDSSAVEAVMQGHYMNDVDYMNLASKSIHVWLCCKKLGIPFTPENAKLVKVQHKGLYSKMKVTNYLTNFGGGPRLMHDTYPDDFPTVKDAQQTQDDLYALLPSLKEYHHAVRWEAHTKTYVTTPWAYRHWYYDVFKRKDDQTIALAKDAKRAVSFKPQNSNAGFQKDNLLLVGYSPIGGEPILTIAELDTRWDELSQAFKAGNTWGCFMGTNVSIHDSLCLDVPDALVPSAIDVLLKVFTRPIPEMRGLQVGAEVEVGENWAEMTCVNKVVMDNYTMAHTEAGEQRLAA